MQEIAKTASHTLSVDTTKKRIYCTITGQNDLPEMTTFFHEWAVALHSVSGEFTVLNDVSQMQTLPVDVITKWTYIRKMLLQTKLAGIAEIFAETLAKKIRNSEKKKIFTNRQDAETWLDMISRSAIKGVT